MASTPYAVRNAGDVASHPKEYIYKTNTKNSEEKCWGLSRFEQWAKDKSNIFLFFMFNSTGVERRMDDIPLGTSLPSTNVPLEWLS
ncbi:hypothetical protein BLOT_004861 [Blomia tropicalis]|nr:hypothetical protein BLOT_004861 [Blomia tropicalis]